MNTKQVIIDDIKVEYYDTLKGGKTIVLIHSFPSNKDLFKNHINILQKEYRVIAPDLPGFGDSEEPKEYSLEYYTNWLTSFIESLNLNPDSIIYGTSFGGSLILNNNYIMGKYKTIVESAPINYKDITTNEFKVLSMLFKVLSVKNLSKLSKIDSIREILISIYIKVKPQSKYDMRREEYKEFIDKLNFKTVKQVAEIITSLNITTSTDTPNVIPIYDIEDPTINYNNIKEYFPYILTTNYHTHVPSIHMTQEVLNIGLQSLPKD